MKEEPVTDALLRQFLLGAVGDQERQRLESMFVTGALSRERVEAAEQHLMDDFLEDSLTPEDKERFLAQYGETSAEKRKLRIAKSIHDWAATTPETIPVVAAVEPGRSRVRGRFWLKPVFAIPIVAVSAIALICAVVWLNSKRQQRNRHLAMQQELVRLNDPSMFRDVSPQTPPLTLNPVSVRSAEVQRELTPPVNADFLELHLLWIQKERYPSYQVMIRRFGDSESFLLPNLQAADSSNVIRLRLSTRFLTRGLYQIEVSGVGGEPGLAEEYKANFP